MTTATMVYEKMEDYGPESIYDKEILMVLAGVKENMAKEMLNEFGSLMRVCENAIYFQPKLTKRQLQKLSLLNEIIKRKPSDYKGMRISKPIHIAEIMQEMIGYKQKEHFCIAILDTKNNLIKIKNISIGKLNACIVHPREVFAEAIKHRANAIILSHNHPSGDPTPSTEDINITHRLIDTGNIIGIKVLDHIIVAEGKFISFNQRNLM